MDLIEGSETSAHINQTLGIHPKIETVNTEHSESLKSRRLSVLASGPRGLFYFLLLIPLTFLPMPPHVPYGLCGLPSRLWPKWDPHEAQLRFSDEVDGDI
jgi:hypothetical protein